jgi:hypothetical protein
VHSEIEKLQLAIGESVCIGETRKPSNCFPAFRAVLLNVCDGKRVSCPLLRVRPVLARN